jgi:hypothetical protein
MGDAEHEESPNQQGACQQNHAGVHGSEVGGSLQHRTAHHVVLLSTGVTGLMGRSAMFSDGRGSRFLSISTTLLFLYL